MAQPALTFADLQAACAHATGIATPETGSSWAMVVSDALTYLQNAHTWKWLNTVLSLDFVAAQNYVALPADFLQIKAIRSGTTTRRRVIQTNLDEIALFRQIATTAGLVCYVAVSETGQVSGSVVPVPRLELYPTPGSNEVGALQGVYVRQLTQSGTVPDVPAHFCPILKSITRAIAKDTENQDSSAEWALVERALTPAIQRDGLSQPNYGPMRGTVRGSGDVSDSDVNRFFPYNGITA